MRWLLLALTSFLFALPGFALPLKLKEGVNEVTVWIVNRGGEELRDLRLEVDEDNLPPWVSFVEGLGEVSASKGARVPLRMLVELEGAPSGGEFTLPLALVDGSGRRWEFEVKAVVEGEVPLEYELLPAFPNPFNPSTVIRYALPKESFVRLEVYDVLGRRVRELVRGRQPAGWHSVIWDGRDELSRQVGSGVYLCRFQAGKFSDVVKLLLSR
ncbi:MAG: hypothetical protein DRQ14_02720 [Candidatus Latescibacterota bacterium]|nr:MAG: hypothetical protein DRQ14_02720 [Candidatus Latescibacterota bacterium]